MLDRTGHLGIVNRNIALRDLSHFVYRNYVLRVTSMVFLE